MPLLFAVFLIVFVNLLSPALAQETTVKLRGPRSTDVPAAPATIGPLSPSDTLWRVAERIRPDAGISLYQVMYALYLKNPDAFLESNLNHLRPGAILLLPSAAEMRQVDLTLARQKSELDDERWAVRQKAANQRSSATKQTATVEKTTTNTQSAGTDGQAAKPQVGVASNDASAQMASWQAELEKIKAQQRQELDSLRSQFADSMQVLESMAGENIELKSSLSRVQHELELLKAQLGDDSEIQQQLKQLLAQQQALLADKAAQENAEQEDSSWQQWLTHPLTWILAACIPALLVLSGILLWVKRRSQKTEQVVSAATAEPVLNENYQSPLPPLDDNNDVDESLFEIDDALLEDAFTEEVSVSAVDDPQDDLLDFDDTLSFDDDDSLLPSDEAKQNQAQEAQDDEFDPENILSDDDLSALLAAADDDDDVIELADDAENDADELLTEFSNEADDDSLSADEDLIEEIDLDAPAADEDELTQAEQLSAALQQPATQTDSLPDDELLVDDALEAYDNLSSDDILSTDEDLLSVDDELTDASELSNDIIEEIDHGAAEQLMDDEGIDDIITQTLSGADTGQSSADTSELDEFAESLAQELEPQAADFDIEDELSPVLDDDEARLTDELNDILQLADTQKAIVTPDDSSKESDTESEALEPERFAADSSIAQSITADSITAESVDAEPTETESAEAESPEADSFDSEVDDDASEIQGGTAAESTAETKLPADTEVNEDSAAADVTEDADHLDDDLLSVDTADDDILLLDDSDTDDKALAALDLSASDDETVKRPTEAALSVENPSKMLDQYPELELSDDELLSELPEDFVLDELEHAESEQASDTEAAELELDPIPEAQFDTLMSELEAMADNLDQAELQQTSDTGQANDALVAEIEQTDADHNFADDDFVEIDNLLASAGNQPEDAERFNKLNVDVGLEDYADIIGEHERRDVDAEDNGYSARLDLVRAYKEIDDNESAELLIDEILSSDAPEHIKTEAQRLKS